MKVLITGINGFIGSSLAKFLIDNQYKVIGTGRNKNCKIEGLESYIHCNLPDVKPLKQCIRKVDTIVHLAGSTTHKEINKNKSKILYSNLISTQNILNCFYQSSNTSKFIFSSTGKVYGTPKYLPLDEKHPLKPTNALGKLKLTNEKLLDFYNVQEKEITITRIFNVFGPNQKIDFLIPKILKQIKEQSDNQSLKLILGDIKPKRDYLYITDVISAYFCILSANYNSGLNIYNICSAKGHSVKDIVYNISNIINKKIEIKIDRSLLRKDENQIEFGSFNKFNDKYGWSPEYNLKDGIHDLLCYNKIIS